MPFAYKLFGVARAANAGVADIVATLGACLTAGVDGELPGSAEVPAAATAIAPTAPVMSFLRVMVEFTICSLGLVTTSLAVHTGKSTETVCAGQFLIPTR